MRPKSIKDKNLNWKIILFKLDQKIAWTRNKGNLCAKWKHIKMDNKFESNRDVNKENNSGKSLDSPRCALSAWTWKRWNFQHAKAFCYGPGLRFVPSAALAVTSVIPFHFPGKLRALLFWSALETNVSVFCCVVAEVTWCFADPLSRSPTTRTVSSLTWTTPTSEPTRDPRARPSSAWASAGAAGVAADLQVQKKLAYVSPTLAL